jgi:hypothetical protein
MKKLTTAVPASMLLCLCVAGCGGGEKDAAAAKSQESARTQLESLQKIVAQTTQTYKAMDNATLIQKLADQSKRKKEPFNSLAYRELRGRKDVSSDSLVSLVRKTKNADALLPLLLLRKLDQKTYSEMPAELRAGVLTDALQQSKMFNTWGLPHAYLEDASKAMLECGRSAYPALMRMLSETRPAPVFGGQEVTEYERYKYRLCDYALFFLEKIQGNAGFVMPVSVEERDALIKDMLK